MKKFTRRLQYGGMRFVRKFRRGEKGFTLMELLIVIGILGVLAAVLVPRLSTFLSSGQVAAANQEVASIETGVLAYYADNSEWPADADTLHTDGYLSAEPVYNYGFDEDGKVTEGDGDGVWPNDDSISWNDAEHKWYKTPAE